MNNGWNGSVVLGNGTHYPILISIIPSTQNVRPAYTRQLIDSLRHWFHIKWNSMHFTGLSMGGYTWGRLICYAASTGDESAMSMVTSFTALEGNANENFNGLGLGGWLPFGHWAVKYRGKYFGLMGTNDAQNTWFAAKNIKDSLTANGLPNTAYFSMENLGGGAHCCWNSMYDPSVKNWLTGFQIGTNGNFPNQPGNYYEPMSIFQWMLRQGDTSLVGGCAPNVDAGINQIVNLPTTTATLTPTITYNCGHSAGTFGWTKISGPTGGNITSPSNSTTTITALVSGVYVFQITVTDNTGSASSDNITVQVIAQTPPSVSAGGDRSVTLPSNSTTLSGSAFPTGGASSVTVAWTYRSGPSGSSIVSSTATTTVINNLVQGTYVFRLTATDNNNNTNFDEATITVLNAGSVTYPRPYVGTGEYQTGFIDASGKLWGLTGQLVNIGILSGGTKGILNAIPVTPSTLTFLEVKGILHGLAAVDVNRFVWTMGDNTNGQSGCGTSGGNSAPCKITTDSAGNAMLPIDHVTSYFMGNADAGWYAYAEGGNYYYVWGPNRCGARGDGSYGLATSTRPILMSVPDGKSVQKIISGYVSIMLCTDGSVYTCGGGNTSGVPGNAQNLGYAATGNSFLFWHQIATNARDIAGGKEYNYIITSTGTLMGFGFFGGYMGAANNGIRYAVPTDLTSDISSKMDGSIVEIDAMHMGTYALTSTGKWYYWGDNAMGNAGNGVELDYANTPAPYAWNFTNYQIPVRFPVQVTNKSNFQHIFVNECPFVFYAYAIDSTGQMYSFGRNKSTVVANQQVICNGTLESPYPNWGDVTWPTPVSPFTISTTYQSTCPLCLIHPDSPSCSVCSLPVNPGPSANAGANQVVHTSTAILDGSLSVGVGGGHIVRYVWSQISGPSTAIIDVNAAISPNVSGLLSGVYVFQLQVIDDGWKSATSTVTITVTANPDTKRNHFSFPIKTSIRQP